MSNIWSNYGVGDSREWPSSRCSRKPVNVVATFSPDSSEDDFMALGFPTLFAMLSPAQDILSGKRWVMGFKANPGHGYKRDLGWEIGEQLFALTKEQQGKLFAELKTLDRWTINGRNAGSNVNCWERFTFEVIEVLQKFGINN